MRSKVLLAVATAGCLLVRSPATAEKQQHNVIIFVADGLRYGSVDSRNAPNMESIKERGVDFTNSHSLFPTITTANASAIATGHYIGDTGNFGNILYVGQPMDSLMGSTVSFLGRDAVLDEMNRKFTGNYLGEVTLMATARTQGWQTAIFGVEGPARIQDLTATSDQTLIVDNSTGHDGGIALPDWFKAGMKPAFVDDAAPKPSVPDIEQEVWMAKAATRIVLPHFKENGKPFVLLFWSNDPDWSQHFTRDSIGELQPGINGPTGEAGVRNADGVFGELLNSLRKLGLDKTTDIFVTADHGFATINHDDNGRNLPPSMLITDLGKVLNLPMPKPGFFGSDPANPEIIVNPNGGADLIYLPSANAQALASDIVKFLATQTYVSGIFVNDKLGKFPGTLAMSDVGLMGAAKTPQPAIVVNFRSYSTCGNNLQCAVQVGDTTFLTGQGDHGSLNRATTRNFMAAFGPDFKKGFSDPAPVSNADIVPTLAKVMGLDLPARGRLVGRTITEALPGGVPISFSRRVVSSDPSPEGLRTYLDEQIVGNVRYFDAAGFQGRTLETANQLT